MKILIADDSRVMRQIVVRTLRQAGFGDHDLIEAVDGKEALDMATAEKPDLVLLRLEHAPLDRYRGAARTPGGRGRRQVRLCHVRVHAGDAAAAEAAGSLFFIVKPFTAERFDEVFAPILG